MHFVAEKKQKIYFKLLFRFINRNSIIQSMEHQKILDLLNQSSDSKFVSRTGTLPMINQVLITMSEMTLSVTQKY